jgi:uncharacterized membrane protein
VDWRVLAAGAMILWSAWGVIAKITTERLGPKAVVLLFAAGYFLIAAAWTGRVWGHVGRDFGFYHWLALACGVVSGLGGILFYLALEKTGHIGMLVALSSQYVIIVFLVGVLALHEPAGARQVAGAVLAVAAIALLAL